MELTTQTLVHHEDLTQLVARIDAATELGTDFEFDGDTLPNDDLDFLTYKLVGVGVAIGNEGWYVPCRHREDVCARPESWRAVLEAVVRAVARGARVWVWSGDAELQVLTLEGVDYGGSSDGWYDGAVAWWLAGWGTQPKLKKVAMETFPEFGHLPDFKELAKGRKASEVPVAELGPYCAKDAWLGMLCGRKAYEELQTWAPDGSLVRHFHELDMPLVEILRESRHTGMAVDVAALEALQGPLEAECAELAARFCELTTTAVKRPFKMDVEVGRYKNGKAKYQKQIQQLWDLRGADVSQDRDVSYWCYEVLKVWPTGDPGPEPVEPEEPQESWYTEPEFDWDGSSQYEVAHRCWRLEHVLWEIKHAWWKEATAKGGAKLKRTGTGFFPTDRETIEQFIPLGGLAAELVEIRLQYSKLSKLLSTYIGPMVEYAKASKDGRIHPRQSLTGTETQRFSHSQPNFGNLPSRTKEGKAVREAVVAYLPGERARVMGVVDANQAELRIMGHCSEDPELMACYMVGEDVHAGTLTMLQQWWPEAIRVHAKTGNFSCLYNITAPTLAIKAKTSVPNAELILKAFNTRFAGVLQYRERVYKFVERHGYIMTLDGFRRRLDNKLVTDWKTRAKGLRWDVKNQAGNVPVQGSVSGLIKQAMIHVHRQWTAKGWRASGAARILVSEHDSIVFDAWPEHAEEAGQDIKRAIESLWAERLRVPMVSDFKTGKSWASAK